MPMHVLCLGFMMIYLTYCLHGPQVTCSSEECCCTELRHQTEQDLLCRMVASQKSRLAIMIRSALIRLQHYSLYAAAGLQAFQSEVILVCLP